MASQQQTTSTPAFRVPEEGKKLVKGNSHFAWDLYSYLAKKAPGKNLFFSPASISVAMAMTYLGAKDNTANEMRDVLKLANVTEEHLHAAFSDLHNALQNKSSDYKLHMANRLYASNKHTFLPNFLADAKTHYKAEPVPSDFASQAEAVRQEINSWVAQQTADKIKDLIPQGVLNPLTAMVLVNAIYFKGDWAKKFKNEHTHAEDFFQDETDAKFKVDMMTQTEKFKMGFDPQLETKVLEMPYINNSLSMVILLPLKPEGLPALEEKLTGEQLHTIDDTFGMQEIKCKVSVPKFKLTDEFQLSQTLKDLGMKDLFEMSKANLSGMDGSRELYVSDVIHKAFIEVNEEGSEAAAATAVVVTTRALIRTEHFQANHPFIFLIRDNNTGSILFLGRIVDPPKSGAKDEL